MAKLNVGPSKKMPMAKVKVKIKAKMPMKNMGSLQRMMLPKPNKY